MYLPLIHDIINALLQFVLRLLLCSLFIYHFSSPYTHKHTHKHAHQSTRMDHIWCSFVSSAFHLQSKVNECVCVCVCVPVPSSNTEALSLALLKWLRTSEIRSSSLTPDSPFTPFFPERMRVSEWGSVCETEREGGRERGDGERKRESWANVHVYIHILLIVIRALLLDCYCTWWVPRVCGELWMWEKRGFHRSSQQSVDTKPLINEEA